MDHDMKVPLKKRRCSPSPTPVSARQASTQLQRKRATIARTACETCRSCKTRCEGERPSCRRCTDRGLVCRYATLSERETRVQALKRQNDALRDQVNMLQQRMAVSAATASPMDPPSKYMTPSSTPESPSSSTPSFENPEEDSPRSIIAKGSSQLLREDSGYETDVKTEITDSDDPVSVIKTHGDILLNALGNVPIELSLSLLCSLRNGNSWEKVLEGLPSDSELQTMETASIPASTQESPSSSEDTKPRASVQSLSKFAFGIAALPQAHLDSSPWINPIFDRQGYLCGEYLSIHGLHSITYPATAGEVQQMLRLSPTWNMLPKSRTSAPNDPFWTLFNEALGDISAGYSIDQVCGTHAWASALYDEQTFLRAPKLTQLVVQLVKSMKPRETGPTLTSCAMIWIYWTLFRWMLAPSPETFAEIPQIARPTSWQTFASHTFMVDTVLSPALRSYLCETQWTDMRWCTSAWTTLLCDWNWATTNLLCRDGRTSEIDLSPICKSNVGQSVNWSMGPSVREHLPDVDRFFKIRLHDSTEGG